MLLLAVNQTKNSDVGGIPRDAFVQTTFHISLVTSSRSYRYKCTNCS